MLPSFYIENFRLFDQLTIKRLGRVNLIVGRNNSGKSAFLEAVLLYVSNASPLIFYNLAFTRQDDWSNTISIPRSKRLAFNPIRHFFKGHRIPDLDKPGFKIAINENVNPLTVKTQAWVVENTPTSTVRRALKISELKSFGIDNCDLGVFVNIVSEQGGKSKLLFSQELDFMFTSRGIGNNPNYDEYEYEEEEKNRLSNFQFIPTRGISDSNLTLLWDAIALTGLEHDVVNALKLIEKKIIGFTFVDNEVIGIPPGSKFDQRSRIPLVKLEGLEEKVPLKCLGEGMTRVLHIILALVNAKNGYLLVDELENGLHWSVQELLWKIIFQLSEQLNVQVFCSTHSRDCISSFGEVWKKQPEAGAFFRLYDQNGVVKAREYDIETLSDSLEMDVEVR